MQARQGVQGAGDGRGQARGLHALVERHEVGGVHVAEDLLAQLLVGHVGLEQGEQRAHRAGHEAHVGNLERAQRLGQQRDDLNLAGHVLAADKLHAELGELARLAAQGALLAHHGGLVAQAGRKVGGAEALGGEARDGQREIRAQHEQAVVEVKELEGRALDAAGTLQHAAVFQQRRLDRDVAVRVEAGPHRVANLLARASLLRQNVPKAPRRADDHVLPPIAVNGRNDTARPLRHDFRNHFSTLKCHRRPLYQTKVIAPWTYIWCTRMRHDARNGIRLTHP